MVGERHEEFANAMVPVEGMAQRHPGVQDVTVAPTLPHSVEVPRLFELGHDSLGGSLGNADHLGDIPKSSVGVL